jgi:hypothetical protein
MTFKGRFCPHGPLCHVHPNGVWKFFPKMIRKNHGVGPLFDTSTVPVESEHTMKDLWPEARIDGEADGG